MIQFTIPGKITGKGRPRFTISGHVYTPKTTSDYEKLVKCSYLETKSKRLEGPIRVTIAAVFEIPKSYTKHQKIEADMGTLKPTKKPDVDNITKIILDALNGVAYQDDKQVIEVEVVKHYGHIGEEEHVIISLEEI